jgi:hypothetical protein
MMRFFPFSSHTLFVGVALCAALAAPSLQASEAQCILAGRLNQEGRWAPAASGVQLLDAAGQRISSSGQPKLEAIKAVRIAEPALLAQCNAGQAMADGDANKKSSKSPAPALAAADAPVSVQATAMLPGRAGGQWVELRLEVPAERLVMLTR